MWSIWAVKVWQKGRKSLCFVESYACFDRKSGLFQTCVSWQFYLLVSWCDIHHPEWFPSIIIHSEGGKYFQVNINSFLPWKIRLEIVFRREKLYDKKLLWKIELDSEKNFWDTLNFVWNVRLRISVSDSIQLSQVEKISDNSLRGFTIEMIWGKQFLDQILCHLQSMCANKYSYHIDKQQANIHHECKSCAIFHGQISREER